MTARSINQPIDQSLARTITPSLYVCDEYLKRNSDFHFTIYSYSNSRLLLENIDRLWSRVGPYIFHAAISGNLKVSMKHHTEMFEGFSSKDKNRIKNGIRGDLESAAEFIRPFIENQNK